MTILDNMAAIFPPRQGQYLFGPMAKIAFSQPPLIESKLATRGTGRNWNTVLRLGVLSAS